MVAAAAASSGGCDSLAGAIDGRRRGFHGGIYLRQDRAAGIKEREGEARTQEGWKGQPPAPSPPPAVSGRPGPACPPLPCPSLPRSPPPLGRACPTLARLFREACGLVHGGRHLFPSSGGRGFVVEIGVKEAAKRNFTGNPALPEPRAMRLGPPGAAARRASPFAAVGNAF